MACAQQLRTSQDTQLSPNQVVTEQQSLVVIKRLLAIAVSGITYLRGIFPEKAYGKKYVEDQQVMILIGDHSCPGAVQILQWMQGCFDAIQKKYLRTVVMSIYTDPGNPEKVTEFYQFKIQYTSEGAHMDFESQMKMSCGNTKKASILLVRKLYTLMQNLGPLPENVCVNMKLSYYEDVTPQEYQPPGFKEAERESIEFELEPVKLAMGEVITPFHMLKLDMTTERHRLEQVENSVNVEQKWVLKLGDEDVIAQSRAAEEHLDNEETELENTEIQISCCEQMDVSEQQTSEINPLMKKTSDMDAGAMRTRSGRLINSTTDAYKNRKKDNPRTMKEKTTSQYEILNSQETPASLPAPKKKRKISQPKE
ncbi:HORMA domain-containing protein 1 isoform X2 [Gouania willdenowi]|uniref:HORMA domain-containing protein 1 isoform X2 n=1 Tax=Gouania willdenowi TaxID=441366 RepID=UPI0010549E99|nr:HORMA domain-containing protein 1-like isoform X2 [Gouania willdenowi]